MKTILKYLICNLKANKTYEEMLLFKEELLKTNFSSINFILAPSSIYLPLFKNSNINLCAQDIVLNEALHLTGDISIEQLKNLDVKYAIIGHYERRKYYCESEKEILKKIKNALDKKIKVIYCIGESKEEKDRKVEYLVLEKQIAKIFNNLKKEDLYNIIIAYEPYYLIGNNNNYDILRLKEIINFIKYLSFKYYHINIPLIFGGNINTDNIKNLLNLNNLDGFIICSSILNPENIPKIVQIMTTIN